MADFDFLSCPFCSFDTREFSALTRHVDKHHPDRKEKDKDKDRRKGLTDFELAQVTAFEEAGIPVELALSQDGFAIAGEGTTEKSPDRGPSMVRNGDDAWVQCACGETVLLCELDIHAEMHAQESISIDDIGEVANPSNDRRSHDLRRSASHRSNHKERRRSLTLKDYFFSSPSPKKQTLNRPTYMTISSPKRLGRAELGPYAHERRMPDRLYKLLIENDRRLQADDRSIDPHEIIKFRNWQNQTRNVIPILAHLSNSDDGVVKARYCSFETDHIYKIPNEGGFCGYRNIQMLLSYIRNARIPGYEHFPTRLPTILELQDQIEDAWTNGYNSAGRVETGGIRMTRKYIGTPEAEALMGNLNIECQSLAFSSSGAEKNMLAAVGDYFQDGEDDTVQSRKVVVTDRGPIYYQHRGHSMTVVGIEWRVKSVNLVVFDPMFATSAAIKALGRRIGNVPIQNPSVYMKACRRGHEYLSRYKEFELLTLTDKSKPQRYMEERDEFGLPISQPKRQTPS